LLLLFREYVSIILSVTTNNTSIARYRLLLEDLYKNTPDEDKTKPKLKEALELIKTIAQYVNEAEMKVENIQVTSHMVHKLKLKGFIKPSRYILGYWAEENDNTIFCRGTKSNKIHNCELYVFSDILVVHKRFDSLFTSKVECLHTKKGHKITGKKILNEVQIIMGAKNGTNDKDLTVKWIYNNSNTRQITFLVKTPDDLQKLESALRKSLNATNVIN